MILGWADRDIERRRSRRALRRLNDEQLKDIGLTRSEIDGHIDRLPVDRPP
jgi:uncharacterized protein YjiS (DUF1127 family)